MKKSFFYLVSFAVICLFPFIYAMEMKKEFIIGNAIFSCQATSSLLEKITLNQDGLDQSHLIIPSSKNANKSVIQVSSGGKLYVGSLEQTKQLCIKDRHGKVKIAKQSERTGSESLDEARIKEKMDRLQVGETITALFIDNNEVIITFDRLIKLISADDSVFHVQQSKIIDSELISGIMTHDQRMAAGEIKLGSSEKEIKMLLDFVTANEEERKELMNNLSTLDHIELVSILDYHS
ncbi:MAG: hypothetical protein WCD44_03295, partial [Candidatus Babeliales bacterium]